MKELSKRSRDSKAMASADPVSMLKEDHGNVKKLFDQFEKTDDERTQMQIARSAINELKVHAAIEEEIFYPAVEGTVDDEEIMAEATQEHHVVHFLIDELDSQKLDHDTFHAKFMVLAENVRHHIKEEEGEMFPKIDAKETEMQEIGARMAQRKQQLMENPDSIKRKSTQRKSTASSEGKSRSSSSQSSSRRESGGTRKDGPSNSRASSKSSRSKSPTSKSSSSRPSGPRAAR